MFESEEFKAAYILVLFKKIEIMFLYYSTIVILIN